MRCMHTFDVSSARSNIHSASVCSPSCGSNHNARMLNQVVSAIETHYLGGHYHSVIVVYAVSSRLKRCPYQLSNPLRCMLALHIPLFKISSLEKKFSTFYPFLTLPSIMLHRQQRKTYPYASNRVADRFSNAVWTWVFPG